MTRLVLASASPARLATLRSAGVDPIVQVAGVDEDAIVASLTGRAEPARIVLELAKAKAHAVVPVSQSPLLIACDSMLLIDGQVVGKPHSAEVARQRWRSMRGRSGVLLTGHWLVAGETEVGRTAQTRVEFADLTDAEVDAYVATGEPLHVAGGFTVDGLGGPYVTRIEGDFHNVVGISLPLVRELLAEVGIAWHELRTS
ncbi:Maf family protein [Rarobacter faecitabidus]|uniref:Nucleoside triphosphate pyrophosphatase n=1 Tax=Rarobacter faecitabidus TaxID=13243 RepID=A0A542ZUS6_RARFA|nr:Maf family protein [Rarobacter faecitabidus]TQL64071.1 septum formation protein [Rarobacter faecitabidus]